MILRETDTGDLLAERVNTIGYAARKKYGKKVVRLSFDAGFTCPNRDGTLGTGGCLFCGARAGSDFSAVPGGGMRGPEIVTTEDFVRAAREQSALLSGKWPDAVFFAYLQNHTNTYAPPETLRRVYSAALSVPGVLGLIVATRPDCLPEETLDVLQSTAEKAPLLVELGLQTTREDTAARMNRCCTLEDYDRAVSALSDRGIPAVTHLILGLPGETKSDMLASVRYVCGLPDKNGRAGKKVHGLKLHMLNVVRGSGLAAEMPDYVPFPSIGNYASLVCDLLENIPEDVFLYRLTADAPADLILAPAWSRRKRAVLNAIGLELRRRGTGQGAALDPRPVDPPAL